MTKADIATVERKLDDTRAKLKATEDPERKRALLKQMRTLIAELDAIIYGHTPLPKP